MDDHTEDYNSLTYEDWCDLLSTIKVKDESNRAAVHIKNISYERSASLSNSDESVRIPRRKKAKTGILNSHKSPRRTHNRHHGSQRYCVLYKKSEMPERKYALHSTKDFNDVHTKLSIKDEMGGPIGSRIRAVQQHKKSEKIGRRS